ncbi:MAG: hypothetical protein Q8P45_00430 [Candidatus Harrisonbacteria bacterium]|nr:hypothetical protein [Candidatus Harrisonbacteria bacterium]
METMPDSGKIPEGLLALEATKKTFQDLIKDLSSGGAFMGKKILWKALDPNETRIVTVYYNTELDKGGNDFPEAATVAFEEKIPGEEGDIRTRTYRLSRDGSLVFTYDTTDMRAVIRNTRLHDYHNFNEEILKREGVNLELVTEAELQDLNAELSGILQTLPQQH